jgi:hypothetical protein
MEKVRLFLNVFLVGFVLNAIWEFLHFGLYYDLSGIAKYPHLFLATVTDAVIIVVIFLIISLVSRGVGWVKKSSVWNYLVIVLFGLGVAVFIEIRALWIGRWAYRAAMPTVFGIGVSPLLQLAVTGILSLVIVRRF